MKEDGRREISEGVVWLALALLALLPPLPFVNEGNVDRYFRALAASPLLIIPLIIVFATMFPRGLRLPLGPLVLCIAPPGAYFVSYYSASRRWENWRSKFTKIVDQIDAIKDEQNARTAEIVQIRAEIEGDIGLANDGLAKLATDMLLRTFTNYDAVLGAEIAAAIDDLREKLAESPAATTAGILDQDAAVGSAINAAVGLIKTRTAASQMFGGDTLQQVKGMTIDSLTRLAQRSQAGAAQIAAVEAEVAEVTQPGRGRQTGSGKWTDDRIRELHAQYETRGAQTAKEFAKQHSIDRSYMYERFRRLNLPC